MTTEHSESEKVKPAPKLTKLVIDRREWLRGTGAGQLCDYDNKKCCLGFASAKIGFSEDEMRNITVPIDLVSNELKFTCLLGGSPIVKTGKKTFGHNKWLLNSGKRTSDVLKAEQINDDTSITDKVRESKLKKLFAKHGCKLTFQH